MPLIKRYPNRKLYDTEAKQYITLEGIADIIRQGEDVTVIDNETGEDITTLTLTQIIHEQEKKRSGMLPPPILTGLIQASSERLNLLQQAFSSSMNYWHQIDEEIRQRVQNLINQGDLTEIEGSNLLNKLLSQEPKATEENIFSEQDIQQYLELHQVPTRDDIKLLYDQLEDLSSKLEKT
jgi:polyhydroxyalkanoate synthesis repressor PhaR